MSGLGKFSLKGLEFLGNNTGIINGIARSALDAERKDSKNNKFDTDLQEEGKNERYLSVLDGLELNNGSKLKRNNFKLTFNKSKEANAEYLGYKDGVHSVNFDVEDYEDTPDNIRALAIHEVYGHGIMKYSGEKLHHKSYMASIDSKYWGKTTLAYKKSTVQKLWQHYWKSTHRSSLPAQYQNIYDKYSK